MATDWALLQDAIKTIPLVCQLAWRRTLQAWLYVPIGILCVLLACWGVDSLIGLSSVSFPASVALLVVLFFALILCEVSLGDKRTKKMVQLINIPAGFALRYINVFFMPSFMTLPLSPPVSGMEVGKIVAVFLIGFVVMFATTAYITRGLQLLFGTSKRAVVERAEEMGREDDDIPLTRPSERSPNLEASSTADLNAATQNIMLPLRAQDPSQVRGTGGPPQSETLSTSTIAPPMPLQDTLPPTRPQIWATTINANLDILTYAFVFTFIGLPIYYITNYPTPAHATLSILAYFFALSVPQSYKRILHPVLLSSGLSIIGIWLLALPHRSTLHTALKAYQTKTRYLQLLNGLSPNLPPPGAGDIFTSALDVSIVALALPMFHYRRDLTRHFPSLIIPNLLLPTVSLFGYPFLCHSIGISSPRSLAFASRSLTLALATPATQNLHGDLQLVAVLCIMSGVMGVLVGPTLLNWIRVPGDDYVTRGVAMGGNGGAIATAALVGKDPRAGALGSLSMGVGGTVMVGLSAVPGVGGLVRGFVGMR